MIESESTSSAESDISCFTGVDRLSLAQLNGFTEDRVTARAFARRFLPGVLLTVLLCAGALFSLSLQPLSGLLFCSLSLAGIGSGFATIIYARRAVPVSRISGRPMRRYHRSDAPERHDEFIYVDMDSRTYFIRLVAVSD